MKSKTFFILFIVFAYSLGQDNQNEFVLNTEMNRQEFKISLDKNYTFISRTESFQYFLEIKDGFDILGEINKNIKKINCLPYSRNLTIYSNERPDEITIYVTSVLNNINSLVLNALNVQTKVQIFKNGIILVYTQEDFDQILELGSYENSLLFYYRKYDFDEISPKDFNQINKEFFTNYDGAFINIDKSSIYIVYFEIYKLDFFMNILEIFIAQQQAKQDISLNIRESNKLYLKISDISYKINFNKTELNINIILKLSSKTNDSVVYGSNGNIILNDENSYYELKEDNIELKVSENDCLIEILFSSENNTEILGPENYLENHKLTKELTIVKIPKLRTSYTFKLSIQNKNNLKELILGYNHKISKSSYFYNYYLISASINGKFEIFIKAPYLYTSETKEDEYQILEIILPQVQLDNKIYLSYEPYSYFSYLYLPMNEKECEYIRGNISSIINKYYVFRDIAKKPPEIENLPNYHHPPFDMIKDLNNINTENQTYLSFFQQIDKILNFVRDGHLQIIMVSIQNKIDLSKTILVLPFLFYIETDKNQKPIIKIKLYEDVIEIINNKEIFIKYLKDHIDIPIKSINKTDPYEFIQNFGKIQRFKNKHAQFSYNLNEISRFCILAFPYDYADLINIEIEFENGDVFNYDYSAATISNFNDINNKEFEEFHQNLLNNQMNSFLIPNILHSRKLFLKKKGLLLEDGANDISWDFSTSDGKLKCRVDESKRYNVFLQTSFSFENTEEAIYVMIKCADLFYSNDYKIIGIENQNGGGSAVLYEVWHQLIQQKILGKTYQSLYRNEYTYDFFKKYEFYSYYSKIDTCKYMSSMDDLEKLEDNYGYSKTFEYDIKHNRSGIFDFMDRTQRKRLDLEREYNMKNRKANMKRSTDILIYTDGFSFSATSYFIKGFQNTGGAIIVGYNGNPKIEGTKEFDGSQSPSAVSSFDVEEYYNLLRHGYGLVRITYSESYDDSYKKKEEAPIPREYKVDLIEERVPIYSSYDDSLYDEFISQAEKI